MDPITIIGPLASITNLIHASKTTLGVVNDFRDGDTDIQNLANDITVFTEALSGFERVLRSGRTTHRIAEDVIKVMVQSSLETMKSLEHRLLQITTYQTSAIRRMKWVQSGSAIKKLRERLKEQNAMLQTFLSITHAETFITILSQYPSLSLADDGAAIGEQNLESTTYLKVPPDPRHSRRLSNSASTIITESISAASTSSTDLTRYTSTSSSGISGHSHFIPEDKLSSEINLFSALSTIRDTHGDSTSGQAQRVRQACHYKCYCKCHDENARPPRRGLGKFRSTRPSCTDPTCLPYTTVDEKYKRYSRFIFGALSRAISSHNIRVRYDLNTYRMVSEGCDAMRFVKHGNLNKLKACIQSGEATIWDTAQDGWSLLHTAAYHRQLPIVKYLVELGADVKSGDVASRTPADFAVLKSLGQDATQVEHDVVGLFSEKDDILLDFEFTPLHIAVLELYPARDSERPSLETLITLVDEANNAPVTTNWTEWKLRLRDRSPLLGAIIEYFRSSAYELPPQSKVVHNLIDQKDKKFHWSPLHWATFSGHCDKMKSLVEHGANPLLLSNIDANILHTAAESKLSHGVRAALEIWRRCSDQLDINQINRWGETPLHVASWCSPACVELLLEAGANPSLQQMDGQVPLHHVGLCEKGPDRQKMVSLLCCTTSKDHINVQDVYGRPPILEFLDDLGCTEILLSNGARLDIIDCMGKNIFHHVCLQGEFKSLRVLLDQSAKVGDNALFAETDYSGNTPLIDALSNANVKCALEILALENVGNIIGKDGWAAVHYAAKIGDPDLLEAVFQHSSFMINMKTMDGKGVDTVAMEAGTWSGKIKELTRKYNSFGLLQEPNRHHQRKGSNMTGNHRFNVVSQAAQDIIENGYAVVQLSDPETASLHHVIRRAVEFFRRPLEQKLVHGSIDSNYGYRPFGVEHSIGPDRPDMNESFTVWSDRVDLIPSAQNILELTSSFLDWRDALVPLVRGTLDEIAKSFGAQAAPSFQKASYLQVNNSLPAPLERDMLQEKHENGHMVTIIHSNAPGLEIYTEDKDSKVVLSVLPARNEIVFSPGSVLTTLTGGAITPLYHHVRNHGLDNRQSLMYFVNPEIDEPLYSWVSSGKGELTDIREHVQNAALKFGLPPIEAL